MIMPRRGTSTIAEIVAEVRPGRARVHDLRDLVEIIESRREGPERGSDQHPRPAPRTTAFSSSTIRSVSEDRQLAERLGRYTDNHRVDEQRRADQDEHPAAWWPATRRPETALTGGDAAPDREPGRPMQRLSRRPVADSLAAVEEMLRLVSPVLSFARHGHPRTRTLRGVDDRAGSRRSSCSTDLPIGTSGSSRTPTPLDIDRKPQHLAFGIGKPLLPRREPGADGAPRGAPRAASSDARICAMPTASTDPSSARSALVRRACSIMHVRFRYPRRSRGRSKPKRTRRGDAEATCPLPAKAPDPSVGDARPRSAAREAAHGRSRATIDSWANAFLPDREALLRRPRQPSRADFGRDADLRCVVISTGRTPFCDPDGIAWRSRALRRDRGAARTLGPADSCEFLPASSAGHHGLRILRRSSASSRRERRHSRATYPDRAFVSPMEHRPPPRRRWDSESIRHGEVASQPEVCRCYRNTHDRHSSSTLPFDAADYYPY